MANEKNIESRDRNEVENVNERPAVAPLVDVYENEQEYLLLADLPGVDKDALNISLHDEELLLEAQRTEANTASLVAGEFRGLDYRRTFTLPQGVDRAKVTAELKDGVLALRLPKAEALRPRRIEVRAG
jgi:HSP20 family molecular chaperone IbpA